MLARTVRAVLVPALLAAAAVAAALWASAAGSHALNVVRYQVPCAAMRHGPVRLLLFSDLDFPAHRALWSRIPALVRDERPDAVLIAGDLLDREATVRDAALRREASAFLDTLPAPGARYLAPGEAESPALGTLRESWPEAVVAALANEPRTIEVRGERIDLFVADRRTDPAPWSLARLEGRSALFSTGRAADSQATYRPSHAHAWENYEITAGFLAFDDDSHVALHFGVQPEAGGRISSWRLVRHEGRRAFRLRPFSLGAGATAGRTASGFDPPSGVWCRVRMRFEDDGATTRIRARFWPEAGIEPDVWTIDARSAGPARRARGGVAFGGRASRRAFADLRVVSLVDGQVLLDERFDDPQRFARDWAQRSALGRWLASPAPGAARVVLAHNPDVVLDAIALGHAPDLVVAGHTHGGQVRFPWIGPVYVGTKLGKRFDRGAFRLGEIPLIITSGVGTSVLPLRIGVPPEVAIIDLVPLDSPVPKEGS